MKRKPISKKIVKDILVKSKGRCCLCFGLNRDIAEKPGQIAHIDGNASNDNDNNLVYLCLEHHDRFDSSTRQSKGISKFEVRHYREELYRTIKVLSNRPLNISLNKIPNMDDRIAAILPFVTLNKDFPDYDLSSENNNDLLQSLLGSIQGWYNEIIDEIAHLESQDERLKVETDDFERLKLFANLGFAYVWRRRYLPNVIAITDIIEKRHGKIPVVVEVDAFLKMLTDRDKKRRAGMEERQRGNRSDALIT